MKAKRVALMLACLAACAAPRAPGGAAEESPAPAQAARARHVVIISVDGLRPDAIEKAPAKTLLELTLKGASCPQAETIRPSTTLPSHTSMLTGLAYDRHGVTWNDYKPGHLSHPTVFSVAKKAGRTTAMFFAKDKFQYLAKPDTLDFVLGPEPGNPRYAETTAAGLAEAFAKEWPAKTWNLTFIHLREPDAAGHATGWMGPAYLAAVAAADRAVGSIVATLRASGRLEETAIIVSADHGGSGRDHTEDKPENTAIPWICVGHGVKAGLKIDRVVRTYDTAPTALAFIGVPAPEGIDGKTVEEVAAAK